MRPILTWSVPVVVGLLTAGLASIARPTEATTVLQKREIDLSGEWVDNKGCKWMIYQDGDLIEMVREDQRCRGKGKLVDHRIEHKTYVIFAGKAADEGCKEFVDVPIAYDAQFIVSEDENKIEYKVPETASKGDCVIDLKYMPAFTLTRVKSS